MKRITFLIVLAVLGGLATRQSAPAKSEVADFSMIVEPKANGFVARSEKGCSWIDVSFDCGEIKPCRVRLTQHGVEGVKE